MHSIIGTGKRRIIQTVGAFVFFTVVLGCNSSVKQEQGDSSTPATSVKITGITIRSMSQKEQFPATVVYLNKSNINAPLSGYLTNIYVKTGDYVKGGSPLFRLETKEHAVIKRDSTLQKTGIGKLGIFTRNAPTSGYIAMVMHQQGDFVQEGATICSFTRDDQMYVKVFLPITMQEHLRPGSSCQIILPDQSTVQGTVIRLLNELDPASQSLQVLVKPKQNKTFSENMNLQVVFTLRKVDNSQVVPVSAILSDEKLDQFWVMKMINDSTAVKVPVKIGIKQDDIMQIDSPRFETNVKLITEGNYGLSDTAKVKVVK